MSEKDQQRQAAPGSGLARVVVAHERLMERDALARALGILRPNLSVRAIAPQALCQEVLSDPPEVVILTTPAEVVEARVPVWILLHKNGTSHSVISVNGQQTEHHDLGLPGILDILDEVTGK